MSLDSSLKVKYTLKLFPIYTLAWRVNNYVSRQGKGINWRKESADLEPFLSRCSTEDINQY